LPPAQHEVNQIKDYGFLGRTGVISFARVLGQNGGVVNTGDDVREAASALRCDPRKRVC